MSPLITNSPQQPRSPLRPNQASAPRLHILMELWDKKDVPVGFQQLFISQMSHISQDEYAAKVEQQIQQTQEGRSDYHVLCRLLTNHNYAAREVKNLLAEKKRSQCQTHISLLRKQNYKYVREVLRIYHKFGANSNNAHLIELVSEELWKLRHPVLENSQDHLFDPLLLKDLQSNTHLSETGETATSLSSTDPEANSRSQLTSLCNTHQAITAILKHNRNKAYPIYNPFSVHQSIQNSEKTQIGVSTEPNMVEPSQRGFKIRQYSTRNSISHALSNSQPPTQKETDDFIIKPSKPAHKAQLTPISKGPIQLSPNRRQKPYWFPKQAFVQENSQTQSIKLISPTRPAIRSFNSAVRNRAPTDMLSQLNSFIEKQTERHNNTVLKVINQQQNTPINKKQEEIVPITPPKILFQSYKITPNQLILKLKHSRIKDRESHILFSGNWQRFIEQSNIYFHQFSMDEQPAVIALCLDDPEAKCLQVVLWAELENRFDSIVEFLPQSNKILEKYVKFLEKKSSAKTIMFTNSLKKQELLGLGFTVQRQGLFAKRTAESVGQEKPERRNILFISQSWVEVKAENGLSFPSDEIPCFKGSQVHTSPLVFSGQVSNCLHYDSIHTVSQLNTILKNSKMDTYASKPYTAQMSLITLQLELPFQKPFAISNNHFRLNATSLICRDGKLLFQIKMQEQMFKLVCGKDFGSSSAMIDGYNGAKPGVQTNVALPFLRKQLYGAYPFGKYYANWDVCVDWIDQLPGCLIHSLNDCQRLGQYFWMMICKNDRPISCWRVQPDDFDSSENSEDP